MSCNKDFINSDFNTNLSAPTDVSAKFKISNDNSGMVTIAPQSVGGIKHEVVFGDGTTEKASVDLGGVVSHIFAEGSYDVEVTSIGYNEMKTTSIVPLMVSFRSPENLEVTITNDTGISRQVNVVATADYASTFDVYFGDNETPVSGNIGSIVSYVMNQAGPIQIRVVANSGGVANIGETSDFEVTEFLAPINVTPSQKGRIETDYISIFSDAYTDEDNVNYFPDWGQGGQGSSWASFELNGDAMLKYINLSYQGIEFGSSLDLSEMEYLHFDVWTMDCNRIETSLISVSNGEKPVWTELNADEWTSIDIPISAFTDQGLTVADIHQLKFVGDVWATGTVFIDNIYFYKEPTGIVKTNIEDFEGDSPTFNVFGNIASIEIIDNPDATGINTSSKVAQFTKTAGAENWGGTIFDPKGVIDLENASKISLKVWSPKSNITVKFKIENADASTAFEVDKTTSVSNGWEELIFDFSAAASADYINAVIFFDFENAGDDSVYYFDDLTMIDESGLPEPQVLYDLEESVPTFNVFGNIAGIEVIDNPDASGINTSSKVARFTKTAGAENWGGTIFASGGALNFDSYSKISLKTWSPKAGAVVKFKIENEGASVTYEIDMNTSVTNSWEELIFDFSEVPTGEFINLVIFFDFENAGDDSVYYFDDITLTN
ncbi:PKD domain protein [Flavobacteriaceae bacterium]|nr:PKD domain protein [Flavobacteriaceae bacterium]